MITLLIQLYESEFPQRNTEFAQALQKNIECKHIDNIVVFADQTFDVYKHEKIKHIPTKHRMTYAKFFEFANQLSSICIIANSDVYFDESLKYVTNIDKEKFLCLSRWNDNKLDHHATMSQDAWIFNKQIPQKMIESSDFFLGELRCDNRIAYHAMMNQFEILNPCLLVKVHHLHKNKTEVTYERFPQNEKVNMLHLTSLNPSSTMKYNPSNVCSFINMGSARVCGNGYFTLISHFNSPNNKKDIILYDAKNKFND